VPPRATNSSANKPLSLLRLALRLPGAVRVGEPVHIELRLRNEGPEPVELLVPGRPPAFDLVVSRKVFVQELSPTMEERIPEDLDGIRVEIVPTGPIRALGESTAGSG
jgi:hypothetical protein